MTNNIKISLIIPTYNPRFNNLVQVLSSLKNQAVPLAEWECILVDNASTNDFTASIDTSWHPNLKVVREERPGLTFARIRGYKESRGELIVFADDDNILKDDYFTLALSLFEENPRLGTGGGKSVGDFEVPPPVWMKEFYGLLAVRDDHDEREIATSLANGYPKISPIGAGMIVRRACFDKYYRHISSQKEIIQDRTGTNLSSGGDNEINILALQNGFEVGYFPELGLHHLIDKQRLEIAYLKRINYASSRSWVKLLYAHKICPWKPIPVITVPIRQAVAYFKHKPWRSPAARIKYAGICGLFKGLSELNDEGK